MKVRHIVVSLYPEGYHVGVFSNGAPYAMVVIHRIQDVINLIMITNPSDVTWRTNAQLY